MSTKQGTIFNIDEAQGKDRVQYETTAASAQAEAPNSSIAHEVEQNAGQVKGVAEQAAHAAQGMGPEMTGETGSQLGDLEAQLSKVTNAAAADGQNTVHSVTQAGASYLGQAKELAESVWSSAQGYISGSQTENDQPIGTSRSTTTSDVLSSIQSTAASAIGTTQQYVEPHIAGAKAALQPHVDSAKETVQGYLGMARGKDAVTPPVGTGIPATTLPLENGQNKGSPYPSTNTVIETGNGKLHTTVA